MLNPEVSIFVSGLLGVANIVVEEVVEKQTAFNQTAFRILMILQWLADEPLTYPEINAKFLEHPRIEKKVSQDTLWLYINTLKALGCKISRPAPRNGYRYTLQYHPFSYFLNTKDIRFLKEILSQIDEQLGHWDIYYFKKWLSSLFQNSANPNREEMAEAFFEDMRLNVLETREEHLKEIEAYCQTSQLLQIHYNSPSKGSYDIDFLPQKIFHVQGFLYLQGFAAHLSSICMLRMDRIQGVTPQEKPALKEKIIQQYYKNQTFILRFPNCTMSQYEPYVEDEECLPDPDSPSALLVKFDTDNRFLLKQRLLESAQPFQVLHPLDFKEEVEANLLQMRQLYQ